MGYRLGLCVFVFRARSAAAWGRRSLRAPRAHIANVATWLLFGVSAGNAVAANVVGAQFAVTEGGAASLTVPIQVPRGIGGMEPQLALTYSSGAGNGLLGLGWSLQGPSAITRCPMSRAIDGVRGTVTFTASDRYCLDGQRLLLVDPQAVNSPTPPSQSSYGWPDTEYRTERDSFSRIRAVGDHNGQTGVPRGFRVETKGGLILEFGNVHNTDAQSSAVPTLPSSGLQQPPPITINRWMLRRISDRHNSFVEFEYCQGKVPSRAAPVPFSDASSCQSGGGNWTGSALIHAVRYTNRNQAVNGAFLVLFRYEDRPDINAVFNLGTTSKQTQRLTGIQTFVGGAGVSSPGTPVRSYDIFYEPLEVGGASKRATRVSRISSIVERAADGTTLPPFQVVWAQETVLGAFVKQRADAALTLPTDDRCGGVIMDREYLACP
jgi:hypothetical protein